ncbi:MAG: hypothetical protein RLZZ361_939 [Cyanobacteriota bacterium]|jgi:hypothetical protein
MKEGLEFSNPGFKQIEDFVPYNESIIWQISNDYYQQKGLLAWSDKNPKIIPHKSGSNYQNALNIIKILKKLQQQFHPQKKIKFLECGAGSGRFSRHLLLAARDEGFIDNLELYVSDFSEKNLDEIKSRKILSDINDVQEGVHYHYLLLDITRAKSQSTFDFIFLHFVFDALKLTILQKNSNQEFKELYVSSSLRNDIQFSVIDNVFLQARLQKDFQWKDYEIDKQSELEKKFFPELLEFSKSKEPYKEIFYMYSALEAMQNLISMLDPCGLIFSSDIKPHQEKNYIIVGNALAHEVDNNFLTIAFPKTYNFILNDDKISRVVISPSRQVIETIKENFQSYYGPQNTIQEYIELESQISNQIEHNDTTNLKQKSEKLFKYAPYNAYSLDLIAKANLILGNKKNSNYFQNFAKSIDYWEDLD